MFFPIFALKTLPTWTPKSTNIDETVVSTGLSKNVPHFDDIFLFFCFCKKGRWPPNTVNTNKKQWCFALPRDAPRFTKNVKKRSKNHPKIPSNWSSEASKTRLRKTTTDKVNKNRKKKKTCKIDDFWDPKLWGTNGG